MDAVLLPEVDVRVALGERLERVRVLVPPLASLGVGTLRALRLRRLPARERDAAAAAGPGAATTADDAESERYEMIAGYDRYEPLAPQGKRGS